MNKIKKPSLLLYLTEFFRAIWEYFKGRRFISKLSGKQVKNGQTVFVIPGFLASDLSTAPLRRLLKKKGYRVYGWERGTNLGNLEELDFLEEKIDQYFEDSHQKISLIGWSLGGIYARELGKRKADKVRQIITLGSPFAGINEPNNAAATFRRVQKWKGFPEPDEELLNQITTCAPVPTTAIYSKNDGIVPWECCMEPEEDDFHENIEVASSHLGMGVDVPVLEIILDRLKYSEENWLPYADKNKGQMTRSVT